MTQTQAEALRVKSKQLVDPPACEHPFQEMERTDGGGDLTGNSHCIVCGESVTKEL